MMTDPISDMLTRLRNALAVKKAEVVLPYSKLKHKIAEILVKEGYLVKVVKTKSKFDELKLVLKYENKNSAIRNLKRISKPGCRIYVGKDNLPKVLNNLGIAILSTSKGLLTANEAKRQKLGGEVICEIY